MDKQRWTFSQGLLRMMRTLLIRAAIVLAAWVGLLYLMTPWINSATANVTGRLVGRFYGIFILPGVVIGAVMAWRLVEAAGFAHWIVTAIGIAFAIAAIAAGVALAHAMQPINAPLSVIMVTSIVAALWIGRQTLRDS